MLPAQLDREIRRLLATGAPQRQIAERLGVSRTSVQAIATGRRECGGRVNDDLHFPKFATSPDALPERCGGCGGLVHMPCVYCAAVRFRQAAISYRLIGKPPLTEILLKKGAKKRRKRRRRRRKRRRSTK